MYKTREQLRADFSEIAWISCELKGTVLTIYLEEGIAPAKKEQDNKEVLDSLTKIREDIAEIYKTLDLNQIDNIRGEILNFADSIYNGENHSREQYHRIIEKNGTYHELLEKRNLTNGVLDLAMQTILNSYQEHEENNSFIS